MVNGMVKKSSVVLFVLRLFFYLGTAGLPFFHPGISVSYDSAGLVQWFLIIPFEAAVAFFPSPGGRPFYKGVLAVLPLLFFSVFAGGFGPGALPPFCAGLVSFILAFLLFRYPRWGKASALEPFFLAWVCLRLLAFSRSGEDAAGRSIGLTQIILVWTAAVFLLHSAVVYFCLFPRGLSGAGGEAAVFALCFAAALALVFVLPADFVRNTVIANLLSDHIDDMTKPDDNDWGVPENGGGRNRGRETIPGSGRRPGLRGLSEHDWPDENGKGKRGSRGKDGEGEGGESRQYTVMVVASKLDPVYMGSSFRGKLDPVLGFLPAPDEALNRLPYMRLFNTWFDNSPVFERGRERAEVFSLSTLPQNFLPYRPFAVEPTVLNENSGPLKYVHRVFSNMYPDDPLRLAGRGAEPERNPFAPYMEKNAFDSYLEVPLEEKDLAVFKSRLDRALDDWRENRREILSGVPYLRGFIDETADGVSVNPVQETADKILAILLSFRGYQYNVSDNDDFSIAALEEFLLDSKDGDCVEFSNSAALMGRLAGIPSRVVTGYLASGSLQTTAHLRGLAALRSRIKVLQEFPFEDLYLVTDAHSHSWPQFYIPGYGWIDFESTLFAIPPLGMGDGNMRDVVIPLIDDAKVFSQVRAFPWRAVLRTAGFLAALALLGAYLLRYGREIFLRAGVRRGGRAGARSLYLLLLARLAADGKPIKPASKTAVEYAELFPEPPDSPAAVFAGFAALYTELRWRQYGDPAEQDERFRRLKAEYRNILRAVRRRGVSGFFIRILSLRGLAYL
ncbi:MAG: transglutaminase-like domain-containing protein [Treponema sp.]|jgi:transglutaminase-like putative cysteine protease|nr:transglutaminase-like domain-containing protein [Treponema sp.]